MKTIINIFVLLLFNGLCYANDQGFGETTTMGDFNGDGFKDLVVSAPNQTVSNALAAGAIYIIYADPSSGELNQQNRQVLTQENLFGYPDGRYAHLTSDAGDRLGTAVAPGYFNDDKFQDLAVSIPYEDGNQENQGLVVIIYGSEAGLATQRGTTFLRLSDIPSPSGGRGGLRDAYMGFKLVVSNFGRHPNEVGSTTSRDLEDLAIITTLGEFAIFYGSPEGIAKPTGVDSQLTNAIRRESSIFNAAYYFMDWGMASMAAGDFDGDGWDDLALGEPRNSDTGTVAIYFGSEYKGLQAESLQVLRPGIFTNHSTSSIRFGATLAAGDFDANGKDDLVVGYPHEIISDDRYDGAVYVYRGIGKGLYLSKKMNAGLLPGTESLKAERFGYGLAAGDFDNDGASDLAIAATVDSNRRVPWHGALFVIPGTRQEASAVGGLSRSEAQKLYGAYDHSEAWRSLAPWNPPSLAVGDIDGDGRDDMAFSFAEVVPGLSGTVDVFTRFPRVTGVQQILP